MRTKKCVPKLIQVAPTHQSILGKAGVVKKAALFKQASCLKIFNIERNRNLFGWPELMAFLRVLAGRIPMKKM